MQTRMMPHPLAARRLLHPSIAGFHKFGIPLCECVGLNAWSYIFGLNASHETVGFQFVKVPFGLSFHAHTCSV